MTDTQKPASRRTAKSRTQAGFTAEERAAMKDYAQELKTARRRGSGATRADGESDLFAKIAEMTGDDRAMAERVHAVITAAAPGLEPRTWYGMPGLRQGRQGGLLLPARGEVQGAVLDARF